jgi:hypothetical protein
MEYLSNRSYAFFLLRKKLLKLPLFKKFPSKILWLKALLPQMVAKLKAFG